MKSRPLFQNICLMISMLSLIAALAPRLSLASDSPPSNGPSIPPAVQAPAVTLTDDDRSAIHEVVAAQLDAFGQDDASGAFALASPVTKRHFRTPENFMRMVQIGYTPVYRHKSVEFGRISQVDGNIVQRVYLVAMDDQPIIALYFMEQEADGRWLIDGCVLADKPQEKI